MLVCLPVFVCALVTCTAEGLCKSTVFAAGLTEAMVYEMRAPGRDRAKWDKQYVALFCGWGGGGACMYEYMDEFRMLFVFTGYTYAMCLRICTAKIK